MDASVVVIYGPNGAGKTSVLSAIELALTGDVATFRQIDDDYSGHLVHREAKIANINMSLTEPLNDGRSATTLSIDHGVVHGTSLLEPTLARFFGERCYLAQATLGKLLEIYQFAKAKDESPLTVFVKDLLGLARLDALIDGLYAAGNVSRVKKIVPEFGDLSRERERLADEIAAEKERRRTASLHLEDLTGSLRRVMAELQCVVSIGLRETEGFEQFLDSDADAAASSSKLLSDCRGELTRLRERAISQEFESAADSLDAARLADELARRSLDAWNTSTGKELERIVAGLRDVFPQLPSVAATDATTAYETALERIDAEVKRCSQAISLEGTLRAAFGKLNERIMHGIAMGKNLDEQIGNLTDSASEFGKALAKIVPHVHDNDCPVCGRDFSEVSDQSLIQYVTTKVTHLTVVADRLAQLLKARELNRNDVASAEREIAVLRAQQQSATQQTELAQRKNRLLVARGRLEAMQEVVAVGSRYMRAAAESARRLSKIESRNRLAVQLRDAVGKIAEGLHETAVGPGEKAPEAIARLLQTLDTLLEALASQNSLRSKASGDLASVRKLLVEIEAYDSRVTAAAQRQSELDATIRAADGVVRRAKHLRAATVRARTAIVRRVLNEALNKLWRDLFVRLAPQEPFVPAFRIPESDQQLMIAQLETVHRDGGTGGTPGTMLSAGNLNTAALTLFFALNLSIEAKLPWLLIDDPVQSMDEVHIAQFAALLRTLSRQHGRQIVLAVHDRALFDYLTLELNPSAIDDRLITVELVRPTGSDSSAKVAYHYCEPDPIFSVA